MTMTPQQLGVAVLCRLLDLAVTPWAEAKLVQGFGVRDIDATLFVDTAARGTNAYNLIVKFWNGKNATIPASSFTALLDDPRFDGRNYQLRGIVTTVLTELGKRTAREIGVPWIQRSLEDKNRTAAVARWIEAGMLSGAELDIDWIKALVAKPRLRTLALNVLKDRRLVEPGRVGLAWLLELARSPESDLAGFAQRMLLEAALLLKSLLTLGGVDKLWDMAIGGRRAGGVVRTFAAIVPRRRIILDLGPRSPEAAKLLGIPAAPRPRRRIRPRRSARCSATRGRMSAGSRSRSPAKRSRGGAIRSLVYELAGSPFKESRARSGQRATDGRDRSRAITCAPRAGGVDRRSPVVPARARVSHKAGKREVALTLIRRLWPIGSVAPGAARVALMDSPDRDVRLFAVRLFWDRHRPKPLPEGFTPRKQAGAAIGTQRFADFAAVRQFARIVLFGLPPGRIAERDPVVEGAPQPERALAASIAKRRLIESMRDVAMGDVELARTIAPVLGEMSSSIAKGEWQASLQALTQLRTVHPELVS